MPDYEEPATLARWGVARCTFCGDVVEASALDVEERLCPICVYVGQKNVDLESDYDEL